jgi:glycosyltransferase involved in cell wall biosynthesis
VPEPPGGRRPASGVRVALVHDWLTGMRGGERVLEALVELFPDAPILTLVHDRGRVSPRLEARRPRVSFLQWLPLARRFYRQYLPLFPVAIEQFDLDEVDLVVSSSHCAAKAVVAPGRARHLCYCYSPMRYAWDQFDAYFGPARVGRVPSWLLRRVMARLARWDRDTAARVDRFVAISRHVAGRIRRYYNREAAVVYPPVDTEFFCPDDSPPESFVLVVSALVPYKRIDVAIAACQAARTRLVIVGDGPERARLARLAGPETTFLGRRPADEVRALYRRAAALLHPAEEDFGLAPVEAQACGRPVVALARGGAAESVEDGVTGVLAEAPTPDAFAEALDRVRRVRFDPAVIRERALRFSRPRFFEAIGRAVDELLSADRRTRW